MVHFSVFNPDTNVLTTEGELIAESGSHEFRVWAALPSAESEPMTTKDLETALGRDVARVGQGKAMKNKWVARKGDGFVKAVRLTSCQHKLES